MDQDLSRREFLKLGGTFLASRLVPPVLSERILNFDVPIYRPGEIIWNVDREKPGIYFTFDDCDDTETTGKILEIADKNDVRVTLFPSGNALQKAPQLFVDALRYGHAIENHTFDHKALNTTNTEEIRNQIQRQSQMLQQILPTFSTYKQQFLRPPYGAGVIDDNPELIRICKELGFAIAMWSSDSQSYNYDPYGLNPPTQTTITEVFNNIMEHFNQGEIIVQHTNPIDMVVFPLLINASKKNRWKCLNLRQLAALHQRINSIPEHKL